MLFLRLLWLISLVPYLIVDGRFVNYWSSPRFVSIVSKCIYFVENSVKLHAEKSC